MTVQISGSCNDCGQCCGCETAPNRAPPFPPTWPEAVRNWTVQSLNELVLFQITGHPDLGAPRAASVRIANKTFHLMWVPGVGLVADMAPWGDESTYAPQCPFLLPESGGVYPCGVEGTQWDGIREAFGCRWLPDEMADVSWAQWTEDHPACSYVGTPV